MNNHFHSIDLSNFIPSLTRKYYKVILSIDANELNILYNNGVYQLLQCTELIDIIDEVHGVYKIPKTHIRGRHRIAFLLSTGGITSFNEVTTSIHRGKFIDLHLKDFLKNSYASLSKASSRTLQSTNTKNVVKYKQHLKSIFNIKSVLDKVKLLQTKVTNNLISSNDFPQINGLDELLTSGMLKVEHMITRFGL